MEVAANHTSIVVTFAEKIAVFDARTLEDRLTMTTCHPSPGLLPNPIALGPRWVAYAERKMIPSKRSAGGCDCDGVSSYTATMLNAAKTLSKGLRELGEQVAAGLTGTTASNTTVITSNNIVAGETQQLQPGIVTILDIKVIKKMFEFRFEYCLLKLNLSYVFFSIPSKILVQQPELLSQHPEVTQLLLISWRIQT